MLSGHKTRVGLSQVLGTLDPAREPWPFFPSRDVLLVMVGPYRSVRKRAADLGDFSGLA